MIVISGLRGVCMILDISFLSHDTSLYQHKEAIHMNLNFEKSSIFFFLKALHFFQHFIIICFILYYFITSYIITIKNCGNKKVLEYRSWPVWDTLWADGALQTFVDLFHEAGFMRFYSKSNFGQILGRLCGLLDSVLCT